MRLVVDIASFASGITRRRRSRSWKISSTTNKTKLHIRSLSTQMASILFSIEISLRETILSRKR